MTYGKRLQKAMDAYGIAMKRTITRLEISKVAGCSTQNIGMIINNSKGLDQKLTTESHAKVCAYLQVNSDWLLKGTGLMKAEAAKDDAWPFNPGIVSHERYMALPEAVRTIVQVRLMDIISEQEAQIAAKQAAPRKAASRAA